MLRTSTTLSLLLLLATLTNAQHEGHDMGDDMDMPPTPTAHNMAMMTPYIHFSVGDTIWFEDWVPKTKGAVVGACIGLFLLGILERWIAAVRAVANMWWRARTSEVLDAIHDAHRGRSSPSRSSSDIDEKAKSPESSQDHSPEPTPPSPSTSLRRFRARFSAPPMSINELCRGILYAAQAALMFAFMLIVMTYQGGFIISLVLGLGFGEMLFGRYTNAHVGLFM